MYHCKTFLWLAYSTWHTCTGAMNRTWDSEAVSFPVEWMKHMLLCKSTAGHPNGFSFVSGPGVLPQCVPWPSQECGWLVAWEMWATLRGKDSSASSILPTDHFTDPRQVNPFIEMKWGGIMHCGCEMLNPVLAFLWGRSSHGDIENRVLERYRTYPSKHDADIAQCKNSEIYMCVYASSFELGD